MVGGGWLRGREVYGKSLYFLLNCAVKPELLSKIKPLSEQNKRPLDRVLLKSASQRPSYLRPHKRSSLHLSKEVRVPLAGSPRTTAQKTLSLALRWSPDPCRMRASPTPQDVP